MGELLLLPRIGPLKGSYRALRGRPNSPSRQVDNNSGIAENSYGYGKGRGYANTLYKEKRQWSPEAKSSWFGEEELIYGLVLLGFMRQKTPRPEADAQRLRFRSHV